MQLQLFSVLYIDNYKVEGMPVALISFDRPLLLVWERKVIYDLFV